VFHQAFIVFLFKCYKVVAKRKRRMLAVTETSDLLSMKGAPVWKRSHRRVLLLKARYLYHLHIKPTCVITHIATFRFRFYCQCGHCINVVTASTYCNQLPVTGK